MSTRNLIVISSLSGAVILLVLLLVVSVIRGRDEDPQGLNDRWAERELLLPDADYHLPDVEEALLMPRVHYFIDPDEPLSSAVVDELEPDLPDALRRRFTEDVENELEGLLFDE